MDFLRSHLIMNAPWVQQQTHPKLMTGNGQLKKVSSAKGRVGLEETCSVLCHQYVFFQL